MKKSFWKTAAGFCPWLGLLLGIGLLVGGCQTEPVFNPPPRDLFGPETNSVEVAGGAGSTNVVRVELTDALRGDRFAINDLVTVKFSGVAEQIPPHEERIKDDGTITLPLIGTVKAVGKTSGELQTEIQGRYVPDYYKRMTITVTGEQRVYYVGGQVRQPGRQLYSGITTVTKAIQSAGDFTDFAAKRRVVLTRGDGKTLKINCIKAAKDASLDLPIYPGDKIEVPMRDWHEIFE